MHSPARRGPGSSFPPGLVAVLIAGATLGALAAPGVSGPAPPGSLPNPLAWSNGRILCNFTSDHPAVTVSAIGTRSAGLYVGIFEVDEVAPTGATVANASVFGATWSIANESTASTLMLAYTASVPVRHLGPSGLGGSTQLAVDLSTGYDTDSSDRSSYVVIHLAIVHWPWSDLRDTLSVRAPAWPAFALAERLASPAPNPTQLTSDSSSTGMGMEYFGWGDVGAVASPAGTPLAVPVSATVAYAPEYSTVAWTFGSGAAGGSNLTFDSRVGIVLPPTVLGVPLYEYALVGTAAGLVGVIAAVGLRQVRRRPSSIEFVPPDEDGVAP